MGIEARFTDKDISDLLKRQLDVIDRNILRIFRYVGQQFVKDARENVTDSIYSRTVYDARGNVRSRRAWELTGNLRNSIGFFVYKDGILSSSEIEGVEGDEAREKAKEYAESLVEVEDGYQLIGVAGMEYASYVEAKGFDVITVASEVSIINLQNLLKKMSKELERYGFSFDM